MRKMTLGVCLLAAVLPAAAAGAGPARGLDHFYNLEYDEAAREFRAAIAAQPGAPDAYNHLAQTLLYRAMYRSGMLEATLLSGDDILLSLFRQPKLVLDAGDDEAIATSLAAAIGIAESRLKVNENDAQALFALGVAHGLRANYSMLVKKAWLDALRSAGAARRAHNRAARLDASNVDARMMQGLNDYVVATLPAGVRFLASVAGIRGDKQRGLAALAEVARRGRRNRDDARILLAAIYRHESRARDSAGLLAELQASYPRNPLMAFARVFALLESGEAREAAAVLDEVEGRRAGAAPGYASIAQAKLQYVRGSVQLRAGDFAAAAVSLERAAAGSTERFTRARSLIRLGQLYDLRGQRDLAKQSYRSVAAIAPNTRCSRESEHFLARPYRANESD